MPLTKTFTMRDGQVSASGYPNAKNFNSVELETKTLADFYKHLMVMAGDQSKPSLLKGGTTHVLKNESRKGKMPADRATQWVCLDLDEAPFSSHEEFMRAVGLQDVSYIVQYSASYKVKTTKKLNCHIFALLSAPMKPQELKSWLTTLNLDTPALEQGISLSGTRAALHWPLDITVCQNDKLIYIAPPIFINMKDPVRLTERINYVKNKYDAINVTKMGMKSMTILNKKTREKLNALRTASGLDPLKSKLKVVGENTVQTGVDEADYYEIVDEDDEIIRLNIGATGDSRAYWVFKNDFELLRNFKGEPFTPLKEILPDFYKQLSGTGQVNTGTSTLDQATGTTLLAFRDKTTSKYYSGVWAPEDHRLELNQVSNKEMLIDFLMEHQVPTPPYIPTWDIYFNPQDDVVVDTDAKRINTFVLPKLMRRGVKGTYPLIQRIIDHAIGTGPVQEHFLNWLAVIIQYRIKTKTAWILHGTEGTGKGLIVNEVLKPIMQQYVTAIRTKDLVSEFNEWIEKSLIVFVDEVEVTTMEDEEGAGGKIRNLITEPVLSIRRMRTDAYNAENFSNFILASNKLVPVRIPPGDRRFNVAQFQNEKFAITTREVRQQIPKEISAFTYYLLHRTADMDLAATVLKTEDRERLQSLSIGNADRIGMILAEGDLLDLASLLPDEANHEPLADGFRSLVRRFAIENKTSITRDELRIIFEYAIGPRYIPQGAQPFAQFLKRHIPTAIKSIKVDGEVHRNSIKVNWKITQVERLELQRRMKLPVKPRLVKAE